MARTKGSSKGCIKCIARKIKCDESKPFCQKCLKAGYTCVGYRSQHSKFINQYVTDSENLRLSRDKPRTEMLFLYPRFIWRDLSPAERQLFVHISSVHLPFLSCVSERLVSWRRGVELFTSIGISHDFVMHALLAWSASHVAEITKHSGLKQEAYYHCDHALKGLQKAIANFSKENSDAVLCASIIMAWQASDSKSWKTLMCGAARVKATMAAQNHQSCLSNYIQGSSEQMRSAKRYKPRKAQKMPHQTPVMRDVLLANALQALKKLNIFVAGNKEISNAVADLIAFVESMQSRTPRAKFLRPLKNMLFFFPAKFIPMVNTHPAVMIVMAYLHAVALFVEPAPDIDLAYFRNLNIGPIETFYEEFLTRAEMESGEQKFYRQALSLMEFPLEAVEFSDPLLGSEPLVLLGTIPSNQDEKKELDIKITSPTMTVLENFPIGLWHHMLGPD